MYTYVTTRRATESLSLSMRKHGMEETQGIKTE